MDTRGTAVTGQVTAESLRVILTCTDDPKVLWAVGFMTFVFLCGAVYWCVRSLFSLPLVCASAFCSLRLPTEYERNGRYEGSR